MCATPGARWRWGRAARRAERGCGGGQPLSATTKCSGRPAPPLDEPTRDGGCECTEASPSNKLCTYYYHTPPRPRQTPEPTAGSEPGLALDLVVFWRFTPEQVADEIIPASAYSKEPSGQSPSAAME